MSSLARKPIVFVSSTFDDLKVHRADLKLAFEKAQYDVECMEKYPAFDERPLDKCLADVARADVYVLLLANRYGYRPKQVNPDPDHPWVKKWIDDRLSEDGQALASFRAEVEARHVVNRFTDPKDLASLVQQALSALQLHGPSPAEKFYIRSYLHGWVALHQQALEVLALASHRQESPEGRRPLFQPLVFPTWLAMRALEADEGMALEQADQRKALLGYLIELNLLCHPGADAEELRFPLDPLEAGSFPPGLSWLELG